MLRPLLTEAPALERVVARVNIISPSAFSLAGTVTRVPEHRDLRQQANALVDALRYALYDYAYSRELKHELPEIAHGKVDRALIAELRRANSSRNRWDRGWSIEPVHSAEQYVVRKKRAARLVQPGEFLLEDPPQWPPSAGSRVRLRVARESTRLQSSFYFAFGETLPALGPDFDLVRFYWNVHLASAPELVSILTTRLNHLRVPFRLKVLTIPAHYDRLDAAVLFVQKRFFPITADLIVDALQELAPLLGDATPLFTQRLGPGLGFAENPGEGGSFGTSRCRLLAEGLWDAHVAVAESNAAKVTCVEERFAAAGLSLNQPHLDTGSTDTYVLPQRRTAPPPPRWNSASLYADVASDIGAVLCRDALWSGNQCAWLGDYYEPLRGQSVLVHRSLGGNVYAGSAGIALFLAELAHTNGEATFAGVGRAGAEHALTSARDTLLRHGIGYYTGLTGVVSTVVRIGELLSDQALIERALAALAMVPGLGAQPHATDVLSGWAGSAVALLDLCARYPNQQITDFALHLAGQLLELTPSGADAADDPRLLTGFSHGAAGQAWALSELYVRSSDERFRRAALRFLQYERRFFDAEEQNWRDLRTGFAAESDKPRFADSWCNGAAGIALSRARIHQLLSAEDTRMERDIALQKAASVVQKELRSARYHDYSLCHGVVGCADVLLSVDQMRETTQFTSLIHDLADAGSKRFRAHNAWPSGVSRGDNPGLLLGLAGTGYFYLRLSDPGGIPTVLLPSHRAS